MLVHTLLWFQVVFHFGRTCEALVFNPTANIKIVPALIMVLKASVCCLAGQSIQESLRKNLIIIQKLILLLNPRSSEAHQNDMVMQS